MHPQARTFIGTRPPAPAGLANRVLRLLLVAAMLVPLSCTAYQGASKPQQGAAVGTGVGAAAGAGLGQAIGGDTEATLLGAAIGGVVGGLAGHQIASYMDRQERELRSVAARSEDLSVRRDRNVLSATFDSGFMFDLDSSQIKPGAYRQLDRVAGILQDYPQTIIQVEGHTDQSGPEEYNMRLSRRRAEAVGNALAQRGIESGRIRTVGYGESQPISSDPARNRRVELVIMPVEKQG